MSVQAALAFLNGSVTPPATPTRQSAATDCKQARSAGRGVAGLLNKFDSTLCTNSQLLPPLPFIDSTDSFDSAPPSPISLPYMNSPDRLRRRRSAFDIVADELMDMFQEVHDKEAAAQKQIEQLTRELERYAEDSTKVKDYEIRVEYLVDKLEYAMAERDNLEKQLKKGQHHASGLSETKSHASCMSGSRLTTDTHEQCTSATCQEHIDRLMSALHDSEKCVKMMMEKHIVDLENQRKESDKLHFVVRKQEELIAKLETSRQLTCPDDERPLREQMELQRLELDSKRDLLTQLLKEREDLLKRLEYSSSPCSTPRQSHFRSSMRSSTHKRTKPPPVKTHLNSAALSSVETLSLRSPTNSGRGTPPLSAPPRNPLPPLPPSGAHSPKISERSSSLSSSRTTSSSSTSWSSTEYERNALALRRGESGELSPRYCSGGASSRHSKEAPQSPLANVTSMSSESPYDSASSLKKQGSFWKGWKKKLDLRSSS